MVNIYMENGVIRNCELMKQFCISVIRNQTINGILNQKFEDGFNQDQLRLINYQKYADTTKTIKIVQVRTLTFPVFLYGS